MVVPGIEKRRGLRYVDEHGNAKLGALVPHRIEFGIVDVHALTAGVFHIHSEILEYFQALCAAALDVLLEPRGCPLAVPRGVKVVVTQIGKDHEAIRVAAFHGRDGLPQLVSGAAAQVHDHAQVDRVHFLDELIHVLCCRVRVMAVNVDERKPRPFDFVFPGDQRGSGPVLLKARRLGVILCVLLGRPGVRPRGQQDGDGGGDGERKDGATEFHEAPPRLPV